MSDQVDEQATQPESKRDRQKRRRQERAAQQQQQQRRQRRQRVVISALVAVVAVAVVFALAMLIAGDDAGDGGSGSGGPSAENVSAATVDGSGLSPISNEGQDPAVGQDAPDVTGANFAGGTTTLGTDADGAQAIVLLAHWCPHCRAEVPEVVQWVDDGILPQDVELVAVSTLHDNTRQGWPPDEWLADENWPGQVLADPDESVARAYGLQATPSWVFINSDGEIAQRASGRLGREQLQSVLNQISG